MSSIFVSQSLSLTLRVENTGTSPLVLAYLYKPGPGYVLSGASSSGWDATLSDESRLSLQNGSIAPGESQDFSIQITADAEPVDLASLNVQATELPDGNGLIDCGTPTFAVVQTTAPVISSITISDVTDSSAKISWVTDKASTGALMYGTTSTYGLTRSESGTGTTHSLVVDGLSANTTYHAKLSGTDSDGFTGETADFIFATAAPGLTITNTVTVTATTTKTVTVTAPVATPIPDKTPPKIVIDTKFEKVYESAPDISGKVTDAGGLAMIEYSIDAGKNWLPIEQSFLSGSKSVAFSFSPQMEMDGNYQMMLRSKDVAGNTKKTPVVPLVIDRLPPRLGGFVYSIGSFPLEPDGDGTIASIDGVPLQLSFAAVGGPTNIDLKIGDSAVPLQYDLERSLWTGSYTPRITGDLQVQYAAVDGAGNAVNGNVEPVHVNEPGTVETTACRSKDATISVFAYDPLLGNYSLWNASQYGEQNPQVTDDQRQYAFVLPSGKYYLRVQATGCTTQETDIFTVKSREFIFQDFVLRPTAKLQIGSWTLPMPSFFTTLIPHHSQKQPQEKSTDQYVGSAFPDLDDVSFDVATLRGKASVVTVLSTWVPQTSSQMQALVRASTARRMNSLVIMEEESASSVKVFAKQGAYTNQVIADPDGILLAPLSVHSYPTHFFLDRRGIIRRVYRGFLNDEQIDEYLTDE